MPVSEGSRSERGWQAAMERKFFMSLNVIMRGCESGRRVTGQRHE
jgi:hypothetical protein